MKEAAIKFGKAYPSFMITLGIVMSVWGFNYLDKKIDKLNDKLEVHNEKLGSVNERVLELSYEIKYSRTVASTENQIYADSLQKAIASQNSLIKSIPVAVNKNTNSKADTIVYCIEKLLVENIFSKGVFKHNSSSNFKEYEFNYFTK